jgi:hypothetical protein
MYDTDIHYSSSSRENSKNKDRKNRGFTFQKQAYIYISLSVPKAPIGAPNHKCRPCVSTRMNLGMTFTGNIDGGEASIQHT